jgi:kynureninase
MDSLDITRCIQSLKTELNLQFNTTDLALAQEMDDQDQLAHFRDEFVISDPNLVYLDGNSLGRLPKKSVERMQQVVEKQWGERLIRDRGPDRCTAR